MRVPTACDTAPIFFVRVVEREPDESCAWGHEVARGLLAKFEHTFDHVLLGFFENACAEAFVNQHADLFFRDNRLLWLADAQHGHQEIAGDVE
jgi:hypothetical protein